MQYIVKESLDFWYTLYTTESFPTNAWCLASNTSQLLVSAFHPPLCKKEDLDGSYVLHLATVQNQTMIDVKSTKTCVEFGSVFGALGTRRQRCLFLPQHPPNIISVYASILTIGKAQYA
jgi:hypothetical protein